MKFMIPFLIAMLPVASIAQSQSAAAPGVPSVAIPKTTEVLRGVPGVAIAPYRRRTRDSSFAVAIATSPNATT
jgi:hypothetical protein